MPSSQRIELVAGELASRLRNVGVTTVQALLRHASSRTPRLNLAERARVDEPSLLRMVNRADLMRVAGIGHQNAALLEIAGVDSVAELAGCETQDLHHRLAAANGEHKLVRPLASLHRVAEWIQKAREANTLVRD